MAGTLVVHTSRFSRGRKVGLACILVACACLDIWAIAFEDNPSSTGEHASSSKNSTVASKTTNTTESPSSEQNRFDYTKELPAILTIVMFKHRKPSVQGSGFLIDGTGLAVTNVHVLKGGDEGYAKLGNGQEFLIGDPISADFDNDLGLFRLVATDARSPTENLPHLSLGDSQSLPLGSPLTAVGSPEGLGNTISTGVLSARRGNGSLLQITTPISHGSSGGPILDSKGLVVGVAVGQLSEGQNLNFAIPVERLVDLKDKAGADVSLHALSHTPSGSNESAGTAVGPSSRDVSWTGFYEGSVYNETASVDAKVIVELRQIDDQIVGCFVVGKPLFGSGPFKGTRNPDGVSFSVVSEGTRLDFANVGTPKKSGGTYHVYHGGDASEWGLVSLHRTTTKSDLPLDGPFDPSNCPDDKAIQE